MDKAVFMENTLLSPQQEKYSYFAKVISWKNRLKAKRAQFLSEAEREVKDETEQLLFCWGKGCVFLNPLAEQHFKRLFQSPSTIPFYSPELLPFSRIDKRLHCLTKY